MTQPRDIKRTSPTYNPDGFAPGRPEEAPKQRVRPILLPNNSPAVAALAKEVEKERVAKQSILSDRSKQLAHEADFDETGAPFVFDGEEEKPKPETSK